MKKFLCVLLSLVMLLPTVASAAVTGEVGYYESTNNVYIAGDLSKAVVKTQGTVSLTITDSAGKIKYVDEIEVGSDLKYETKFKFSGDISACTLNLREGNNDVTESVEVAFATNPTIYSLALRDENESQVIEAEEIVKATANITNKYGNDGNFQLLVAFYDENNKMIACEKLADGSYTFYDITKKVSGLSDIKVPADAKIVKAFMWNNTQTLIPLSKEQIKATGDKTFGGDTEQITVAFVGDSITNQAFYLKYVEHYYHTRYPNKDIIFVNKGISGDSYRNIFERFDYDITESEYSGKIDEAVIFLGYNDAEAQSSYYEDYETNASHKTYIDRLIQNYVDNCKRFIEQCRQKGISLTLVTPVVYDHEIAPAHNLTAYSENSNDYALRLMAEHVLAIAEEYDLPVINMWETTDTYSDAVKDLEGNRTTQVIAGPDGIHPEELGGVYMAYQFAKQQDGNPIVAKVEIDANTGKTATERANVAITSYNDEKVVYEYLAHSIPILANTQYKKHDSWLTQLRQPTITEEINKEIIKVANLAPGTYKITIDENTLLETYTNEELSDGVNIAIDANNPAQAQAAASLAKLQTMINNEKTFRGIARTERAINANPFIDISKFDENSTLEELSVLGSSTASYKAYFSNDPDNFGSKKYASQNWEKLRELEREAREAAKPVQRTVVIEMVTE